MIRGIKRLSFLIVASRADKAALNIADGLLRRQAFTEVEEEWCWTNTFRSGNVYLTYIDVDSIWTSELGARLPSHIEAVVFASRHESESGKRTLTVHVPGNLTAHAAHGGGPRQLAIAWPQRMRLALRRLAEGAQKLGGEYEVSLEVTHHGPTSIRVPVWFVEIGSTQESWANSEAGSVAADAILHSVTQTPIGKSAVGFGGGHYAPKHTKLSLEGGELTLAVGHIVPRYALDELDKEMVTQLFSKTFGGCGTAVIDWKGLSGSQRSTLLKWLEELGVEEVIKA